LTPFRTIARELGMDEKQVRRECARALQKVKAECERLGIKFQKSRF
jgi:DNA-directed RNA polymerase specialized sigma24 family protein